MMQTGRIVELSDYLKPFLRHGFTTVDVSMNRLAVWLLQVDFVSDYTKDQVIQTTNKMKSKFLTCQLTRTYPSYAHVAYTIYHQQ